MDARSFPLITTGSDFGTRLHAALARHLGANETAAIAGALTTSSHRAVPYHPVVVEAWFSGELIPNAQACAALATLLGDDADAPLRSALAQPRELRSLYEDPAQLQASEFTTLMRHYVKQSGLKLNRLATEAKLDYSELSYWQRGMRKPKTEPVRALDTCLTHHGVTLAPALGALVAHEVTTRQVSQRDTDWQAALPNDFGAMLRICRQQLGLTQLELEKKLIPDAQDHSTVAKWEANKAIPSRKFFPNSDITTTYGELLLAHERTHPDTAGWWTPERARQMSNALADRLNDYAPDRPGKRPGTSWVKT